MHASISEETRRSPATADREVSQPSSGAFPSLARIYKVGVISVPEKPPPWFQIAEARAREPDSIIGPVRLLRTGPGEKPIEIPIPIR